MVVKRREENDSKAYRGVKVWAEGATGGEFVLVLCLTAFPLMLYLLFKEGNFIAFVVTAVTGTIPSMMYFILQPPNPIGESRLNPKLVCEMSEEERKILSFIRGDKATTLAVRTALMMFVLLMILAISTYYFSPNADRFWSYPSSEMLVVSLLMGLTGYGLINEGVQCNILFKYVLEHWDEIQRYEVPWPQDRPYTNPLLSLNPLWPLTIIIVFALATFG